MAATSHAATSRPLPTPCAAPTRGAERPACTRRGHVAEMTDPYALPPRPAPKRNTCKREELPREFWRVGPPPSTGCPEYSSHGRQRVPERSSGPHRVTECRSASTDSKAGSPSTQYSGPHSGQQTDARSEARGSAKGWEPCRVWDLRPPQCKLSIDWERWCSARRRQGSVLALPRTLGSAAVGVCREGYRRSCAPPGPCPSNVAGSAARKKTLPRTRRVPAFERAPGDSLSPSSSSSSLSLSSPPSHRPLGGL